MPEVITQRTVDRFLREPVRQEVADARVTGLYLRGSQAGASWQVRTSQGGRSRKWTFGRPPEIGLADARSIATAAISRARQGFELTERWLEGQRIALGLQEEAAPMVPVGRVRAKTWLWEEAVAEFLAMIGALRKPGTVRNYKDVLGNPAWSPLAGRAIVDIDRPMISGIVGKVGKDHPAMAEAMVRIVKRLWGWLSEDEQSGRSGLTSHTLSSLKAPERAWNKRAGHTVRVPTLQTCGEIVAACRSGVLHPTVARALEVIVLTGQRRETVASAEVAEVDAGEGVWNVGAAHMKGGEEHAVPLSPRPLELLTMGAGDPWAFPQARPKRRGDPLVHVHVSTLTHEMRQVGGGVSPHRLRHAFVTAVVEAGYAEADAAVILDHREGRRTVTGKHYNRAKELERKRKILTAWEAALEPHIAAATEQLDVDTLKAAVMAARRARQSKLRRKSPGRRVTESVDAWMAARAAELLADQADQQLRQRVLDDVMTGHLTLAQGAHFLRLDVVDVIVLWAARLKPDDVDRRQELIALFYETLGKNVPPSLAGKLAEVERLVRAA